MRTFVFLCKLDVTLDQTQQGGKSNPIGATIRTGYWEPHGLAPSSKRFAAAGDGKVSATVPRPLDVAGSWTRAIGHRGAGPACHRRAPLLRATTGQHPASAAPPRRGR